MAIDAQAHKANNPNNTETRSIEFSKEAAALTKRIINETVPEDERDHLISQFTARTFTGNWNTTRMVYAAILGFHRTIKEVPEDALPNNTNIETINDALHDITSVWPNKSHQFRVKNYNDPILIGGNIHSQDA